MNEMVNERQLVEQLAEEYVERYRAGERPSLEEYVAAHPQHADEIRDLFPALVLMEELASGEDSPAPAPPEAVAPLERVGDYRILREIGRGGMGVVYEAEQESLGRHVALKVLRVQTGQDPRVLTRFRRESRAAAQMHHTNIVPVYDVGQQDGLCYYAMQFICGQALDEVFRELQCLRSASATEKSAQPKVSASGTLDHQSQPTPDAEPVPRPVAFSAAALPDSSELSSVTSNFRRYCRNVARLGLQAAEALAYAHARGIIHRDIKPANLLLDTTGVLWVSDFGLVKTQDPALTETGDLVGTLRYMAPERFKGECDARADIYALGLTLYEMLVLRPAFDGQDRLHLVEQIGRQEPARPRALDARIPRDLETVVMKSIEKDPRQRYASADDFAEDLRRFLADEPIRARRIGPVERVGRWGRRNPLVASLSAVVVLVAAIGFVGVLGQMQVAQANEEQAHDHAIQAERERDDAQKQRDEVRALNKKLQAAMEQLRSTEARLRTTLYAAHINLAQNAWDKGRLSRVLELLEQQRPKKQESDLRGFEWYYFDRLCHSELLTLKVPLGGGLPADRAVAFSPDFKRLACVGGHKAQKTVKVLDAQSGKELRTLKGHTGLVASVAFSSDGKRLVSGAGPFGGTKDLFGELKAWDAETGKEIFNCKGHTNAVTGVAFSPDGKTLASASRDNTVKVWDAETGKELRTLKGHTGTVWSVAFSPDSKKLASASHDQTVKVWDAGTGKELLTLKGHTNYAFSVAFSPDGKRLASGGGGDGGGLKVWDAESGKELLYFKTYAVQVNCVAFSPDGKLLASGANDAKVKLWDAQTGREVRTIVHDGLIQTVAFSPDGTRLGASSFNATVKVWDVVAASETRTFTGSNDPIYSVAISPDGKLLATSKRVASGSDISNGPKRAYGVGEVRISDAQTGKELVTCKGHTARVSNLAFSADSKRLASRSALDNTVKVWDAQTGKELRSLTFSEKEKQVIEFMRGSLRGMAFSPDGKRLATAFSEWETDKEKKKLPGPDGKIVESFVTRDVMTVKVWDVETGKELFSPKASGAHLAFSPDGKRLANGGNGEVTFWNVENGKELFSLKGGKVTGRGWKHGAVAFSLDGKWLASTRVEFPGGAPPGSCEVRISDAQTGEEICTLEGMTGHLTSVVFSPDGKRVATADWWDNNVKVWDAQTGQELLTFTFDKDQDRVNSLAFSPDGKRLVSNVMIWDATPVVEKR